MIQSQTVVVSSDAASARVLPAQASFSSRRLQAVSGRLVLSCDSWTDADSWQSVLTRGVDSGADTGSES